MSDEVGSSEETPVVQMQDEIEVPEPKLFDMNRRVRLGRSRDQDGKSNIWSIEPTMEVVEDPNSGNGKQNLLVGGLTIGAALMCLPLFKLFSELVPDPSNY
jgi:hypothetical protein